MDAPKPKSDALYVRATSEFKQQFRDAASRFGMSPSEVLRELAQAFVEGRVTVSPPKHVKEFYNVPGSED